MRRDVDTEEIANAYRGSESLSQIAERIGMSAVGVRARLLKHGVVLRRRGRPNTGPNIVAEELAAQYRNGATCEEIAAELGVEMSWVWRRLKAAGVIMRSGGRRVGVRNSNTYQPSAETVARWDEMKVAYAAGETLQVIGNRYGISRERVRQIVGPPADGVSRYTRAWQRRAGVREMAPDRDTRSMEPAGTGGG